MTSENSTDEAVRRQTLYVLWEDDADRIDGWIKSAFRDTFWELLASRKVEFPNLHAPGDPARGRQQDF